MVLLDDTYVFCAREIGTNTHLILASSLLPTSLIALPMELGRERESTSTMVHGEKKGRHFWQFLDCLLQISSPSANRILRTIHKQPTTLPDTKVHQEREWFLFCRSLKCLGYKVDTLGLNYIVI